MYNFNYNYYTDEMVNQLEAFDNYVATMGWAYGSRQWNNAYLLASRNGTQRGKVNNKMAEALLDYSQSNSSKAWALKEAK